MVLKEEGREVLINEYLWRKAASDQYCSRDADRTIGKWEDAEERQPKLSGRVLKVAQKARLIDHRTKHFQFSGTGPPTPWGSSTAPVTDPTASC